MHHLVFLLLGLGSGAVFAALALGLVLSYRSSGVLNFAIGATSLYGAYAYSFLRQGELIVLLPGAPATVGIGDDPGMVASMIVAVLISAVFGALLYLVVFRHLRSAPPVAKAVASLGVMVVLQSLFAARLGTAPITVDPVFARDRLEIDDKIVSSDRIWFALVIVGLALLLAAILRHTGFGTATRAAAESEKGAVLTGLSPERIALANWALSSAVAGLGGILIAPIVPLVPSAYTLLIVPALAAALVANLRSLLLACGIGLLVGMVQSELTFLQTQHSWLPERGLAEAVPLVVILVFLVVRGRPLPERGALILRSLGAAPRPRRIGLPLLVGLPMGALAIIGTSGSYRAALTTSLILGIVALSLVVVTGYGGQVSLAQLALAGVAAFTLSRLTTDWSVPFPIAPLLAALVAAVVGVVVGLPALRVRGLPVAVVTLALAVGLEALWFRNPELTGGVNGATIEPPSLFGVDLGPGGGGEYPRVQFAYLCLVCLCATAAGVALLRRSRLGSAMVAIRANERAAAAMGIDVARTKIASFAIGAFVAGIGGSLLAYQQTMANPDTYSAFLGFGLFATTYLAGVTSVTGGVLAGLLTAGGIGHLWLSRVVHSLGDWYDVALGALLVFNVIQYPDGIASGVRRIASRFSRATATEGAALATSSPRAGTGTGATSADTGARPAPRRDAPTVLTVEGLSVRYGAVSAVRDVTLTITRGQIVGLIGPNGAGKSTVIDAVSGFAAYDGEVSLHGRPLDGLHPHQRTRRGLGRTFQALELWDDLTVDENIFVNTARRRIRSDEDTTIQPDALLRLLHLDDVARRPVKELSQGRRQLVSIARGLATQPSVLLLDEPAAGLDSTESQWLGERLLDLRDAGVTIVMVDHDMSLVLGVCDAVHVLDIGALIASGSPDEIRADPTVAAAYLGATPAAEAVPS